MDAKKTTIDEMIVALLTDAVSCIERQDYAGARQLLDIFDRVKNTVNSKTVLADTIKDGLTKIRKSNVLADTEASHDAKLLAQLAALMPKETITSQPQPTSQTPPRGPRPQPQQPQQSTPPTPSTTPTPPQGSVPVPQQTQPQPQQQQPVPTPPQGSVPPQPQAPAPAKAKGLKAILKKVATKVIG